MSAKKAKKPAPPPGSPAIPSAHAAAVPTAEPAAAPTPSWFDSSDPRKRQFARIVMVGVWIYIAALWLLALDQTFDWGIF